MSIERKEVGPRMSQVVTHGDTVYLAGVVAKSPAGKSVGEQAKDILASIDRYLAEAGTDKTKLLTATIWLTDMASFAEMNAVWDAWVSPGNTPARATVEARLAAPRLQNRDHGDGSALNIPEMKRTVIPGCAVWRRTGIHNPELWLWIPVSLRFTSRPGMTAVHAR